MAIKLKTPPSTEPISLAEAKAFLRITDSVDDAIIASMIVAARKMCEEFTGRALITQTWTLWLDRFPSEELRDAPLDGFFELPKNYFDRVKRSIDVPRPPLQSVTHLKTYDVDNAATVFASSNYLADTASEPGRLALNYGALWPVTLRYHNAVEIEFVAGYGLAAGVPDGLKQGMYQLIKMMFAAKSKLLESDTELVGVEQLTTIVGLPSFVKFLWQPYRVLKI